MNNTQPEIKKPIEKNDDCFYQIEQLKNRLYILEQNSNITQQCLKKVFDEINNVIKNGVKLGKFYNISSVDINKIKTMLEKIKTIYPTKL